MGRPFITTAVCCVFCFLCAGHTQCLFHHRRTLFADASDETENSLGIPGQTVHSPSSLHPSSENMLKSQRKQWSDNSDVNGHDSRIFTVVGYEHHKSHRGVTTSSYRHRRDVSDVSEEQIFVKMLFSQFGEGDTMTFEGFERLLRTVGLQRLLSSVGSGHALNSASLSNIANVKLEANGKE